MDPSRLSAPAAGLVALCWKLTGQESTDAPIAIAFLFLLRTTGLLVSALGALRGKTHALLAGTLLLGTASFVALSAALYGDVPLSFYILATIALLCFQDRYPDDLRFSSLAGFMAGFAAWARNEGILFVGAVIVARAIAMFRFRRPGASGRSIASPGARFGRPTGGGDHLQAARGGSERSDVRCRPRRSCSIWPIRPAGS